MSSSRELVRLLTLPRGREGEEFRISVDEFSPDDGEPKSYCSIRVWYRSGTEMRPGKAGCTVRRGELEKAIEALQRALAIVTGKEPIPRAADVRQQQLPSTDQSAAMENF